jgi:hypothetical protein
MNKDDPDCRMEFCEWFSHMYDEKKSFPDFIVRSNEAIFKIKGTVHQHSCVYWATKNPRITEE